MNEAIQEHLKSVLHHLYINPLEKCNLHCKICYTKKTAPILTEDEILDFIDRYNKEVEVKVITFCGGEVNTLKYFPSLVNKLTDRGIFVQMITNGTVDRLDEYKNPGFINMVVSIDGPREHHDANRGKGRFGESISYLEKAKKLGFHTEIFTVVTRQNLDYIGKWEKYLEDRFGSIEVTYHPRKPLAYLNIHPVSSKIGQVDGFGFLSYEEISELMETRKVFPPKELGCYQIALTSDGTVYGCCEGFDALGRMNDPVAQLIDRLRHKIGGPCLGCVQPAFMCGLKSIYG